MASTNYSYSFDNVHESWTHYVSTSKSIADLNTAVAKKIPKYSKITSVQAIFQAWKLAAATVDLYVESCNSAGSTSSNLELYSNRGAINSDHNWFTIDIGSGYYNSENASSGLLKSLRTYLQYRIGSSNLWHELYIQNAKLQWNYTEPTLQVSVSSNTGGTVSGAKSFTISTPGQSCTTTITASPSDGYRFVKWSDGNTSISRTLTFTDADLTSANTTKTYTATFEKINYHVGLSAVNSDNTSLDVGNKLTGGGTYQIDDTFSIAADAGDTTVAGNTFLFGYWTFRDANGNDMFLDEGGHATHFNNEALASLTVSADTISAWWPTPASSGEYKGEYWIYGIAHYRIVYDFSLSLVTNSINDPGKLGHIGLNSIAFLDSSDKPLKDLSGNNIPSIAVSDLWDSSTDSAQSKTVRVYTNDFRLRIYLANTSHTDDYYIASSSTPVGCAVTGFTDNTNPTPYDATGAVGGALNYRVVASSSTCSWSFEVLKRYFSITINNNTPAYDGNSYHVVKVYRGSNNVEITPNNLSRIIRGSPTIKIDSSEDATKDTPYNAYFRRGSTSANLIEFNISDLKDNYEFTTYATLAPFFTVDTVIDGVSQQMSAYRTQAYTFNIPADTGYKMTATLTEGGTITKTWTQVESISYALPKGVVANTVLNVQKIPTSTAFMHLNTDDCIYGSIEVANNAYDILKTSFQNFTIDSITAHTNYEIVSATYEWRENEIPISGKSGYLFNGISPVNQITNKTITFGGSIPANSDITCVISVRFRKNIIYHSHKQNGQMIQKRPQSLWYTPVGQAPKRVVAVYAQTQDHPSPILLYGEVT